MQVTSRVEQGRANIWSLHPANELPFFRLDTALLYLTSTLLIDVAANLHVFGACFRNTLHDVDGASTWLGSVLGAAIEGLLVGTSVG